MNAKKAENDALRRRCTILVVEDNDMNRELLGELLAQFSIMPELNIVYSVLFSNRGPEFYCKRFSPSHSEVETIHEYMTAHRHAIPLTLMETHQGIDTYFMADEAEDCEIVSEPYASDFTVSLNPDYAIGQRNIVIIGHNSKCDELMQGFNAFRGEHQRPDLPEILNITVIDDEQSLEKHDRYRSYPYVTRLVEAEIFDSERIWAALEEAISCHEGDTSILILSDDTAPPEDTDAAVLTYLIYVQDIIFRRMARDPDFDRESIDVVVEILNPKNYDVVHNYSVDNVVISNRYISKMVTQIGRKQALYEFYTDILSYDSEGAETFTSKELYIKEAINYFAEGQLPGECTAEELIRAVFDASPEDNKAVLLGYTSPGGQMHLFAGDQRQIPVHLTDKDKLIVFSNH